MKKHEKGVGSHFQAAKGGTASASALAEVLRRNDSRPLRIMGAPQPGASAHEAA